MFKSDSAKKLYLKYTALFTTVLASVVFVFAPIIPTLMNLVGVEAIPFFGIEFSGFDNKIEKSYVNVLLLGVDKSERLSDVMMLAQLNLVNNSVNILQIPRDTYINNNRSDKKLNSAYGYYSTTDIDKRVSKTMEEIKTLIDVEFDGYVLVTTSGFRDVIDAVGGIEYNVPADMNYDDDYQNLHIHLNKGLQLLDGNKAEQYVRFRSGYANADLGRIDAQGDFIKEAMKQIVEKSNTQSAEDNNKLLRTLGNMVSTNFDIADMLKYAPYIMKIDMEKVNIMRIDGVPEYRNGVSYFIADKSKNDVLVYEYFSPDTSEVDVSELEMRDIAKRKDTTVCAVVEDVMSLHAPSEVKVYLMDYSGTGGEALTRVRETLTGAGYNIAGDIGALTCQSDKTYAVCKSGDVAAGVAKSLGLGEYAVNPDFKEELSDADVIVIIGKDM